MLLYELDNLVTGNVVYNDTLNPKIYDENDDMRPEVHAALMSVVENFITALDLPNMVVHDIILTGSSANFNWTKFSDIDLHLISDVDVFADPHMAAKYFNAAKNVWNNKHDVDIRGIDVEVYVEDNDEHNESLGRFSVMNNGWITKPDHNTPVFDEAALNRKVRYIMKEIDMLMQDDDLVTDIEHLQKKIWLMRNDAFVKARAEGRPGEYSVENLAFKVLRNTGYLDKILKALRGAEDRDMSVTESFGITGIHKNELNEFLTQIIRTTLNGMNFSSTPTKMILSMSKRLTGAVIPNLFHIRNIVKGKGKFLKRKLMDRLGPYVRTSLKATITDHPELKSEMENSEEYVEKFINVLVNNNHQFKQIIFQMKQKELK